MMGIGGIVAVGSIALLGLVTNYTYTYMLQGTKFSVGVGEMNYNKKSNTFVHDLDVKGSYSNFVLSAKKEYESLKKHDFDGIPFPFLVETEKALDAELYESIFFANDLMIASAVLLPVFTIILVIGIALFVINREKA